MSSTTKAAVISLGLLLLIGGVAYFAFLRPAGPRIADRETDDLAPASDAAAELERETTAAPSPTEPASTVIPSQGKIQVVVKVVDREEKRNLARAELRVLRKGEADQASDILYDLPQPGAPRGADFAFDLPPGRYVLLARCRGYSSRSEDITLIKDQKPLQLVLDLDRGTSISGRILAADRSPIGGAEVAAFRKLAGPDADLEETLRKIVDLEKMQSEQHQSTTSAPDGSYQIDGVQPGEWYTVRAVAPSFQPNSRENVPAPSENIDVVLQLGSVLEGVVASSTGRAIEGAVVEAYQELENAGLFDIILAKARPPVDQARSDSAGRYQLRQLGSGRYNFRVTAPGHQAYEELRYNVPAGSASTKDFTLKPGLVIRGIVRGPDDQPLPGAKVKVNQVGGARDNSKQVRISFADNEVVTDEQGLFEFDTLPDSPHMLLVSHEDYQSVQQRDVRPSEDEISITLPLGGQLEGSVADKASGQPIAGAVVAVNDVANLRKERVTDQDGSYFFSGINPSRSRLTVHVTAAGYARTSKPLTIQANRKARLDFELEPTGTISGRVVMSGGLPVADARIEVRRKQESTGTEQISGNGVTAKDGSFTIADVEPGEGLRIRVKRRTFLDGFSQPFDLASGESIELDAIEMQIGGSVKGSVQTPQGNPIVGCMVSARLPSETELTVNQSFTGTTSEDGSFIIQGLRSGKIVLEFTAANFVEKELEDVEVIEGQINNLRHAVVLETAGIVAGRVTDPQGQGIEGAEIIVRDMADGLNERHGVSAASGEFRLANIASKDVVDLEVNHADYGSFSKSGIQVGDQDVQVVLSSLGRIRGRVVDPNGQPVASFSVQPQPADGKDSAIKRQKLKPKSFADGRFEYSGIPDGVYDLHVRSPLYAVATVPGLRIVEGETVDAGDIALEEGGKVTGRVTALDTGAAIQGAQVKVVQGLSQFKDQSQPTSKPVQVTDEDGGFVFTGLKDGTITLEISHQGFSTKRVTGVNTLSPDKSQGLEIALEKGGLITGVVVDAQGQAMAGMWVYLQASGGDSKSSQRAQTSAQGVFNFSSVGPGKHTLKAHKFVPGGKPLMGEIQVEASAGGTLEVELVVE